jgi:hypothetical protein
MQITQLATIIDISPSKRVRLRMTKCLVLILSMIGRGVEHFMLEFNCKSNKFNFERFDNQLSGKRRTRMGMKKAEQVANRAELSTKLTLCDHHERRMFA